MKLLKISASGLPLFDNTCEIDFLAMQRVSADSADKLSCLFSNSTQSFYLNNVVSLIGINASGKTTILKLITFVCKMLNNESLNNISYNEILDGINEGSEVVFDTYFSSEGNIYLLHTTVTKKNRSSLLKMKI